MALFGNKKTDAKKAAPKKKETATPAVAAEKKVVKET